MSWQKNIIIFLVLFGLVAFAAQGSAAKTEAAADPSRKRILFLSSYHQTLPWQQQILKGVNSVLHPTQAGIDLMIEYMDTKRVVLTPQYQEQLEQVFAHKYKGKKLDLILASDNNAFEFLRKYHKKLFPRVPVVFCGVNFFQPSSLYDYPLFTGVAENFEVRKTLEMARALHPETKQIHIITDRTPTGKACVENIQKQLAGFAPSIAITYAHNQTMEEILKAVSRLPKESIVLLGAFFRDSLNRFYNRSTTVALLSRVSKGPVYGLLEEDIDHGIVGGKLVSGFEQGQNMAQIGLIVLSGRPPFLIPVNTKRASQTFFDFNQLKRFNIDLKTLPPDSIIKNRPRSFYDEYQELVIGGIAFLIAQSLIILFLILTTARYRQSEKTLRQTHTFLEKRIQKRTAELEKSESALRTVFDSTHDAIIIHFEDGTILDVNQRMLKMFGVSREEAFALSFARQLSSPLSPVHRLPNVWSRVIKGEDHFFEWRMRRPTDSTEFDAELQLTAITYKNHTAVLANIRDINIRKESENRLKQALGKLEAIFENSLMGIAMTRGRHFSTINRRGAAIFGFSPDEFIGMEPETILPQEALDIFASRAQDSLRMTGEYTAEQEFLTREKTKIWCSMYGKAIDRENLDKGIIWAWDDITTQKQFLQKLETAREEAEKANKAKSDFLAAMSHEIRTPMNAIVGMTDITLQTDLTTEQQDYLGMVKDSAEHLLSIINDILDLTKIEARKLELDTVDFDLHQHMKTTIQGMTIQAEQKELTLDLEIDADVEPCVKGDPVCLRQILVNLIGNAIKFTHKGGIHIHLSAATKPMPNPQYPLGFTFEVADTGIGIPEEFMESIFQSFSQSTRQYGGTGLGLAICKNLITLMGGEIALKSTVGQGTSFFFDVWLEQGVCSTPSQQSPQLTKADSPKLNVLLAEDNEVNILVAGLRLEEMGHSFTVARNGKEVLDLLARGSYDLVLMDVEMPIMDGLQATRAIRAGEESITTPDIPIIAMTAHALKEFRDKCLEAGMNAYIAKPVDFSELATTMNRLATPKGSSTPQPHEHPPSPSQPRESQPPVTDKRPFGVPQETFIGMVQCAQRLVVVHTQAAQKAHRQKDAEALQYALQTLTNICSVVDAQEAKELLAALTHDYAKEESPIDGSLKAFADAFNEYVSKIAQETKQ